MALDAVEIDVLRDASVAYHSAHEYVNVCSTASWYVNRAHLAVSRAMTSRRALTSTYHV